MQAIALLLEYWQYSSLYICNMSSIDYLKGHVILIDKPLEWTSFQVVNKLRWALRKKLNIKKIKVGHAGTLDPLATGLLVICTGKLTKKIESFQAQTKEYTGEITLGATTPSFDLETEIDKVYPIDHITESMIRENVDHFIGEIEQTPPIFSALKKDGREELLSYIGSINDSLSKSSDMD